MAKNSVSRQRKNAQARARYQADPERFRAYAREWMRKWREANHDEYLAKQRDWRSLNRARSAWLVQKGDAKRRGIPFLLTFKQWCGIWEASGKWESRGKLAGQYVMARFGDVGPYQKGNVRICTFGENVREAQQGKIVSKETRKKNSDAQKRNPQTRDVVSGRFTARHRTKSL